MTFSEDVGESLSFGDRPAFSDRPPDGKQDGKHVGSKTSTPQKKILVTSLKKAKKFKKRKKKNRYDI